MNSLPFKASGRKLTVGTKRPGHLSVMNKSQTLPRSMGSKAVIGGVAQRPQTKPAATPPAVRRNLSVSCQFYKSVTTFLRM